MRENPIGADEGPGSYIHRIAVLAGLVKADAKALKDMPGSEEQQRRRLKADLILEQPLSDDEWERRRSRQLDRFTEDLATAGKSE